MSGSRLHWSRGRQAEGAGVSLRTLDKALWQHSKELSAAIAVNDRA